MKNQACEPCAKREVRCDKEEPCANRKRRKKDHCSYPEVLPSDRISNLEALVRSLGGDPEGDARQTSQRTQAVPSLARGHARPLASNKDENALNEGKARDPVILEEDGQPYYLESYVFF